MFFLSCFEFGVFVFVFALDSIVSWFSGLVAGLGWVGLGWLVGLRWGGLDLGMDDRIVGTWEHRNMDLSLGGLGLWVMGYGLWVMGYGSMGAW